MPRPSPPATIGIISSTRIVPPLGGLCLLLAGIPLASLGSVPSTPLILRSHVAMRDGVHLDTNVFLPAAHGRHPAILVRTPYGKGATLLSGYRLFLDHGYAVVVQDVRGRYGSEGVFDGTAREGPDGYDTLNWIASEPWSDGDVVMSGGSYLGFAQWEAALLGNSHLKGIFPVVSGCDPYQDRFYSSGGALKLGHRLEWLSGNLDTPAFHPPAFADYVRHLPERTADRAAAGRTLDVFQKALSHPAYDGYWKKLSVYGHLDKVKVPVFAAGGWYDNYVEGDFRAYTELTRLGRHPHLVVGPWPHNMAYKFPGVDFGPQSSAPLRRFQLQWYDEILNRPPAASSAGTAPLRIFVMGANLWRDEREWPLARARPTALRLAGDGHANSLNGDGELSWNGASATGLDHFVYNPRNPVPTRGGSVCCDPMVFPWGPLDQRPVERRGDVLVYTSAPLKRDLEVTGPVQVRLWVSTSARDTDFTAKLVDVFPGGEARNLTDGILRLRYRNGLEHPSLAKPGDILPITIDAGPTSNVFFAGHRIRLEIASSNFPRFDRNPNTGAAIANETNPRPAQQAVYHDRQRPSALVLPVVAGNNRDLARGDRPGSERYAPKP